MSRPQTAKQLAAFSVMMLLWHRLGRLTVRFASLAARAAPPPPRPIRPQGMERPQRPARPPDLLPRDVGWLIRLLPIEAAVYGSQLQYFLARPETAGLLEACPQARRLLGPLCRMLLIPDSVFPPPRAKPAPPPPAPPPDVNKDPPGDPAPAPASHVPPSHVPLSHPTATATPNPAFPGLVASELPDIAFSPA